MNVDLTLNDKKPAPRENKHEPLSPCKNNVYLSSSEDFFSDEDTISSSASDATFVAKRYDPYFHLYVVMVVCWFDKKEQS